MRILTLGDVFGRPGRKILQAQVGLLKEEYAADFVIVNCENASGGSGLTEMNAKELLALSEVDVYTSGNHIWDKREIYNFIQQTPRILRPANYPDPCPGKGYEIFRVGGRRIGVVNLSGTVYLNGLQNPFVEFDRIYESIIPACDLICVDFHAEATSEKIAFGYYADGRANLIFGTHTHVQTADERILSGGSGYITDIGMTGPYDGVIGVDRDIIVKQFRTQRHSKFETADGAVQVNGAVFAFDDNGKCTDIQRIMKLFK
ncbi:MAG: TIGR00282 family metallophosphoesterase [Anaerofustis sp.]